MCIDCIGRQFYIVLGFCMDSCRNSRQMSSIVQFKKKTNYPLLSFNICFKKKNLLVCMHACVHTHIYFSYNQNNRIVKRAEH